MVSFVVDSPDLRDVVPGTVFSTEDNPNSTYMVVQEINTQNYSSKVTVVRLGTRPTIMYLDECTSIKINGMFKVDP